MNHPHTALWTALRAVELAELNCPHWDFESDGEAHQECCAILSKARADLRSARKEARRGS